MQRPRDSQRQRVYDAEDRWTDRGFTGRQFKTVSEIQSYVDSLVSSAWFRRHYSVTWIDVRDGRGRRSAGGNPNGRFITVPRSLRIEATVLHEVAHVVESNERTTDPASALLFKRIEPWHGWRFTRTLLTLARNRMGVEAERALREEFKVGRVRYRKPRAVSASERERLREQGKRLAAKETPS